MWIQEEFCPGTPWIPQQQALSWGQREPHNKLGWVGKAESSFHNLKCPLFLGTQARVPQLWPTFHLTKKIIGKGLTCLCLWRLSAFPLHWTRLWHPCHFLTRPVPLSHFCFSLYFLFPTAAHLPPALRIPRKHSPALEGELLNYTGMFNCRWLTCSAFHFGAFCLPCGPSQQKPLPLFQTCLDMLMESTQPRIEKSVRLNFFWS